MTQTKRGFFGTIKSYPRTFWVANTMEIFERMSWYGFFTVSTLYITGPVETGGLGFSSEDRGLLQAIVPFFLYMIPVLTGALADRYGYKKMFIIAYVSMIIAYYALGQFKTFPTFLAAFMFVAVAAAIFKPVVVGTVARVTDESNSAIGFGVFYMMVNIGGFLGPIVAGIVRGISWDYVFIICSAWAGINLVIVLLFYRDPTTEAFSKTPRSFQKLLDDTVEVLGNLRFFITVMVPLLAVVLAGFEFEWFRFWPHFVVFVPIWIVINFLYDLILPADSGKPTSMGGRRRNPLTKRMHCSNWRFALFLLIMSGFWTSFQQIFITMPEYIRDFTETESILRVGEVVSKPFVSVMRGTSRLLGFDETADRLDADAGRRALASMDEIALLAEYDRLIRQARGVDSAVPPEEEEKDREKLASILRTKLKKLRKEAKQLASKMWLSEEDRGRAKEIEGKLASVNKRDVAAMKTAKEEFAGSIDDLGRNARRAALKEDPRYTPEISARIAELLREINTPIKESPLEALDIADGTRAILGYKVRLSPVEFAELLALAPTEASAPSDKKFDYALKQLNKRLKDVRQPKFEDADAEKAITKLREVMLEHGPLVSRDAAARVCDELSNESRTVKPKQLAAALNALAYKDAIWNKIDARRQFNPEFLVNFDAAAIVLFQVIISLLMARFHRFTTMIVGMVIAAVGIGLSAFAGDSGMLGPGGLVWVVAAGIVIFAFGEMMASPTSQEYVGRIAPTDKKAVYMGYYFVAIALGNLFSGVISGQLYGKLARDMQRPDLMWLAFGGIMLGTAIVFLLYNKFALPKDTADTMMQPDAV